LILIISLFALIGTSFIVEFDCQQVDTLVCSFIGKVSSKRCI